MSGTKDRSGRRGHAIVEIALMSPWIFLLFIGVFNFGFWAYASISTANAARVAALYTSSDESTVADAAGACFYALEELRKLPNTRTLSSCAAAPVVVTAEAWDAAGHPATRVTVTYTTVPLIPIPGFSPQSTVRRRAIVRVNPL
jgi:Flp pilus assembly protein TadG